MPDTQKLRVLSANIQAGSSTRGYHDYVARSWSHLLPLGDKQSRLDEIAQVLQDYDIVGLNESDPGSLRSGFRNQTHYLAEQAGFDHWTHQPNRSVGGVASSSNGLLSRVGPQEVRIYPLPGRIAGRGLLLAKFGTGDDALTVAVCHLSLGSASRASQLSFIAEHLHDAKHAVLMGDFNCVIERPEMTQLFNRTNLTAPEEKVLTFPSWKPHKAIDHILISNTLECENVCAMPAAYSDHLAIALDLEVPSHTVEWSLTENNGQADRQ